MLKKEMESTLEKHWQTIYQTKETTKLRLGDWKEQVKLVVSNILDFKPREKHQEARKTTPSFEESETYHLNG
ncbi:hypothetical protein GCM10027454_29830 [Algoriphagus aestuariicola]